MLSAWPIPPSSYPSDIVWSEMELEDDPDMMALEIKRVVTGVTLTPLCSKRLEN
jgi:hypothetical protein